MGVINTSYTFTANDTITSAKMNNIIDDTIMTSTAVSGSTLQVTPSGQLAVKSQGITSNELASASVTQAKIASNVVGTGPAFKAYPQITTSVPSGSLTKVTLDQEQFDTNNNYSTNSRFTPTVSGYYFITASIGFDTSGSNVTALLFVNNVQHAAGTQVNSGSNVSIVSSVIYFNGSTDYIELFAFHNTGGSLNIRTDYSYTSFSGFLIRRP